MDKKEIVCKFVEQNETPKYLFGTNNYAKDALHYLGSERGDIRGIIDEFTKVDSFENLPIINDLNEIEPNAIVLSCVVEASPLTAKKKLDRAGIINVDYYSFIKYSGFPISIPYWVSFNHIFNDRRSEFETLKELFNDDESKLTLNKLVNFRLSHDLTWMEGFSKRLDKQYFEAFLNLKEEGEVFCDVGGYDGDSAIGFIKRCPKYEKIYLFEPMPELMDKAKRNLSSYESIEYCQYAASNKKDILYFQSLDTSSRIDAMGTIAVQADKIDNIVKSPITFLKMDIEGSESAAIEGAKETILKYHPKLAICVYHKAADYIDIPKQILSIWPDYDIFMRHYTEGFVETVMYFVPK